MKVCSNPECGKEFTPKAHNGKYCSPECRQKITNKRVLDRYYEKKELKSKLKSTRRTCLVEGCETVLSRYNLEPMCESHLQQEFRERMEKFGWSKTSIENFDLL